jgi:hypothetical protein
MLLVALSPFSSLLLTMKLPPAPMGYLSMREFV